MCAPFYKKVPNKLNKFRNIAALTCIISITVSQLVLSAADTSRNPTRISVLLATGMPGGSYHHLGSIMASMLTTKLKIVGLRVSAAISEGARENIEALRIKDADLILADDFSCSLAYRGIGPYKDKGFKELRSITNLWPEAVHMLIRSNGSANPTLEDLQGLTIATGLPESGTRFTTEILLRRIRSQKPLPKLKFMNYVSALDSLRIGTVQAADFTVAVPSSIVKELLQPDPKLFRFIQINDNDLKAAKRNGWTTCERITIPPATYPGQVDAIKTVGQNTIFATTSSLDPSVIYDLVRTLFENVDQLAKYHPAFKNILPDRAFNGLVAPLHSGAVRYFKENKIHIPEGLEPPDGE
ncbi:MAG: TAXI family TRAP transporter solute-binding subunit [Desulfomonilaceae bacterium]